MLEALLPIASVFDSNELLNVLDGMPRLQLASDALLIPKTLLKAS